MGRLHSQMLNSKVSIPSQRQKLCEKVFSFCDKEKDRKQKTNTSRRRPISKQRLLDSDFTCMQSVISITAGNSLPENNSWGKCVDTDVGNGRCYCLQVSRTESMWFCTRRDQPLHIYFVAPWLVYKQNEVQLQHSSILHISAAPFNLWHNRPTRINCWQQTSTTIHWQWNLLTVPLLLVPLVERSNRIDYVLLLRFIYLVI